LKRTKVPPKVKSYSSPDSPFALLKSDCIKILGNLSYSCRKNQDIVANLDGLGIILDHCNIQDDYPFIKECSIFAIRNLTQGHAENQDMISKLEPIKLTESSQSLLRDINGQGLV
jgi:ataxin-10